MEKIKVSCPKCNYNVIVEAKDVYEIYNYMTEGATVCKICKTKLRVEEIN